mmetsp:Transcript_37640/g.86975  ORF Transcript_37640/g.86975 Transcript_37640/m.86975 type:complete len:666 (-) Transcript_37640:80-2077(-)
MEMEVAISHLQLALRNLQAATKVHIVSPEEGRTLEGIRAQINDVLGGKPQQPSAPPAPEGPGTDHLEALDDVWKHMEDGGEDMDTTRSNTSKLSHKSTVSLPEALAKHRSMLVDLFHKLDIDKSGVIDAAELRRGLRAVGQHPGRAHRLLQTLDTNKNGKIELAEWIQSIDGVAISSKRSGTVESFARAIVKSAQAGNLILSQEEAPPQCMVSFRSSKRLIWDAFLTLLLIYIAMILPFRLAFYEQVDGVDSLFGILELVIDICFVVDIFLTFRTSFSDEEGEEVFDWTKVMVHYVRTWFFIDVITAIPLEYIVQRGATTDGIKLLKGSKVLKVLKLLRAVKFLKIFQGTELGSRIEDIILLSHVTRMLEGLRIFISCMVLGHLLACLLPILASGFLERYSYEGEPVSSRYITTLYWAITTVTTVGYGDITPQDNDERVFTMFSMIVGGAFYGYVVGNISVILASRDVNRQAHKERLHLIHAWLVHHRFPLPLRRRVWAYYKTLVTNKAALEDSTIFNDLSPELRQDVAQYLVPPDLLNHLLFQNVPSSVIVRVVPILQQITAQAGERITSKGSMGHGMFVILDGIAIMEQAPGETSNRISKAAEVIRAGDSFGEEIVLGLEKDYGYTVAATTKVVMLFIPADDFMAQFASLPEILSIMRNNFSI